MTPAAPQTITPERQIAGAQVGTVFNSVHEYLSTLMHSNDAGQRLTSQPLEYARKAVEEASFWAIKHVLMHGPVAPPKAANDAPAQTDMLSDPAPAAPPSDDQIIDTLGPSASPNYGKFE